MGQGSVSGCMKGPDPRDRIDRVFDTAEIAFSEKSVPLHISQLLEGVCRQGIDVNDPIAFEGRPYGPKDIRDACEHLTNEISTRFEEIVLEGEILHRTDFGLYIAVDPSKWREWFGQKPVGNIDTWEPIVTEMKGDLIARYQMNMEAEQRDPTLPNRFEPFTMEEFEFDEADQWVLCIDVDQATELDKLGLMTRPQAAVYLLRKSGYTTAEAAEILDMNTGTASSHGNRGAKKAIKYQHAAELLNTYDIDSNTDWSVHGDRIGKIYETQEGERVLVLGGETSPSGTPTFHVTTKGGDVTQYSVSAFEDWKEVSGDRSDFEIPEMFRERGFDGERIELDDEPIIDGDDDVDDWQEER